LRHHGLVPVADLFNHRGGGGDHIHVEGGDDDEEEQEGGEEEKAEEAGNQVAGINTDMDGVLQLVAVAAAAPGEELFNSFGRV
jgi:hypothetical protein